MCLDESKSIFIIRQDIHMQYFRFFLYKFIANAKISFFDSKIVIATKRWTAFLNCIAALIRKGFVILFAHLWHPMTRVERIT